MSKCESPDGPRLSRRFRIALRLNRVEDVIMFESWTLRYSRSIRRRAAAVHRIERRRGHTVKDLITLITALSDRDESVCDDAAGAIKYVRSELRESDVVKTRDALVELLLKARIATERGRAARDDTLVWLEDKRAIPHFLANADRQQLFRLDCLDRDWRQTDAFAARIAQDLANLAKGPRGRSTFADPAPWTASVVRRLDILEPAWTQRTEAKAVVPFLIWSAHRDCVWDALEKLDPHWPDTQRSEFPPIIGSYLERMEELKRNPASYHRDDWLVRRALRAMGDERAIPHYLRFIKFELNEVSETAVALKRVAGGDETCVLLKRLLAEVSSGAATSPWTLHVASAMRSIDERRAAGDVAEVLPTWRWHWGSSGWSPGLGHSSVGSNFEERRERIAEEIVVWLWEAEGVGVAGHFAEALSRHCSSGDGYSNYGFGAIVTVLVSALQASDVREAVDQETLKRLATIPAPSYAIKTWGGPPASKVEQLTRNQPLFERMQVLAVAELDRRASNHS